jgi:acetylornithine deacetylase/succinyl-diaminopimelate desuccinylase-like protein
MEIDESVAKKVLGYVDDDEVVRFTQGFVRINSVNPNLEPGSSEKGAAKYLAKAFKAAGMRTWMLDVAPGRPNFYGVLRGEAETIGLGYFGHIDSIALIGMENPFSGEIVDGRIWGRGSTDQKGGVAAAALAMLALARSGIKLKKSVALWGVADEESEHRGAHYIMNSGWKADACISTEPCDRTLVIGHKGTTPLKITFKGVAAHAFNPRNGISAIEKAAKTILELDRMSFKKFTVPELGEEFTGTINFGVIRGGTAYNNVADTCELFLDRRTVYGETQEGVLQEIRDLLARLAKEDPQFKATVEVDRPDWHWAPVKERGLLPVYTPSSEPVAQAVLKAYSYLNDGQAMPIVYVGGYMDMDFFVNSMKIPTVNFGPGEGAMAHTVREALHVEQLKEAVRIYVLAALQMDG